MNIPVNTQGVCEPMLVAFDIQKSSLSFHSVIMIRMTEVNGRAAKKELWVLSGRLEPEVDGATVRG